MAKASIAAIGIPETKSRETTGTWEASTKGKPAERQADHTMNKSLNKSIAEEAKTVTMKGQNSPSGRKHPD